MSHAICYSNAEFRVVLKEAHDRWRKLPRAKKLGKAPSMAWCYDCEAWHLHEPALGGEQG